MPKALRNTFLRNSFCYSSSRGARTSSARYSSHSFPTGMPGMLPGMMGMGPRGLGGMPGMGMNRAGPMPPAGEPPKGSAMGADLDSLLNRQSMRDREKTEKYVPRTPHLTHCWSSSICMFKLSSGKHIVTSCPSPSHMGRGSLVCWWC